MLDPPDGILLRVALSVIAGWGRWAELDLLRGFRPYEDRTPSNDQLGDIFAPVEAEQPQSCFIASLFPPCRDRIGDTSLVSSTARPKRPGPPR